MNVYKYHLALGDRVSRPAPRPPSSLRRPAASSGTGGGTLETGEGNPWNPVPSTILGTRQDWAAVLGSMRPPQRSQVWWGVGSAASPKSTSILTLTSGPLPGPPPRPSSLLAVASLSPHCLFPAGLPFYPACLPPAPRPDSPTSCPPSGAQTGQQVSGVSSPCAPVSPAPAFLPLLLHLPSHTPLSLSLSPASGSTSC